MYEELQSCLDERVLVEAQAVEVAMAVAKEYIDEQRFIEYEWKIQVGHEASSMPPLSRFSLRTT